MDISGNCEDRKSGSEIMESMERHVGAESSGTSEIPEHCLSGRCPFSNAVTGMLESKVGCELPTGE